MANYWLALEHIIVFQFGISMDSFIVTGEFDSLVLICNSVKEDRNE